MPMPQTEIEELIRTAFSDADIKVVDTAGDSDHYSVTVISEKFSGKTRIMQHKMVMDALGSNVGGRLHALSITTKAN